ncbi:hypothetical protein Lqui_2983 [Legionella quinlivanii]|uniref:YqaE/Pmp3 family membrane protein n=1 Tax=Legionella quinlivanii TaxID=45073 RepID=A0A0W0XKT7_9GAMM|nr:hypothetical protein [Legionella quinlivanii]KTD45122.1 hypothetical protein Lqui_2983 [Legionella quinlivanii]MCW8452069.1 hypothetical protein [Legionella quinlivanii]SEG49637.1 Uncharacterized membrane protein YqaE, homolog of Blt101, UPF0057 family [Legionella quinlivanii DSM 21216]STY09732.1 Uncharacterised protein [Legionella quinlivanii]
MKWLMSLLALFFPWLVLLIYDNPGGAIVALVMQATLFGWLPASMWALRVVRENYKEKKRVKKAKKAKKDEVEAED